MQKGSYFLYIILIEKFLRIYNVMRSTFQRFFLFLCFVFLLYGCGCSQKESSRLRIGIDPSWYPLDFGAQQSYVNGFVEELLLDVAVYTGIEFERIEANWDSLFDGLHKRKYDAVLSSLPPYNFNLAQYDFSENFIELGPVLIVPTDSAHANLDQMKGELVGLVLGDLALLQLQKHPDVILRTYSSIPDLLDALVQGEINGAILNRILAVNYVRDLYADKLMVVGSPMTDTGLHLVTVKGKHQNLVKNFNKSLQAFKKKKKLQPLLEKWELAQNF